MREQKLEKTADNFRKVVADYVALIRFPVCSMLAARSGVRSSFTRTCKPGPYWCRLPRANS